MPSSKWRSACLLERVRTEVRSATFEARTPYLFISGLGHCTLLTFYGMLSPEKKVISVIFSSVPLIGTVKAQLGSRKHCPRPAGRSITL